MVGPSAMDTSAPQPDLYAALEVSRTADEKEVR